MVPSASIERAAMNNTECYLAQAFGLAILSLFTCAAALSNLQGDVPAVRHHRRLARRAATTKCKAKAHPSPATAHNATAPATKKKPKKGGSGRKGACFPYGAAFHGEKPSVPASKWWCSDDRAGQSLLVSYCTPF
jgi:hypothetical protein